MQEVTVRVPASTSNLGPGYDCLGVALRLYNDIRVRKGRAGPLPPIARETARLFFKAARLPPFRFACKISDQIPRARGLGSSATVRVGLLSALNALSGHPLTKAAIFACAAKLEGHPDNAAPALFGGFTVVRPGTHLKFRVASTLRFVLLIPEIKISTGDARALLPGKINREAAVASAGNAATIVAAFASGDYRQLSGNFADSFHQPFRRKLVPFLDDVIGAGEKAGALGGFLSGSGSTIACVTVRRPEGVARAMLKAAPPGSRVVVTTADNRGARCLRLARNS